MELLAIINEAKTTLHRSPDGLVISWLLSSAILAKFAVATLNEPKAHHSFLIQNKINV